MFCESGPRSSDGIYVIYTDYLKLLVYTYFHKNSL